MSIQHCSSPGGARPASQTEASTSGSSCSSEAVLSQNIRYLLWRAKIPREKWSSTLRHLLRGVEHVGADDLLMRGTADPKIVAVLAQSFKIDANVLMTSQLFSGTRVDVWRENLKCLLELLPHGASERIAAHLRLDPSTVSHWLRGARPNRAIQQQLNGFFGLDPITELFHDPLFLLPDPPTLEQRRQWLLARIRDISPTELQELFPALKRILRPRN